MAKLKSSCENCKALNNSFKRCMLNYKIEIVEVRRVLNDIIEECRPLEPCPKPITIKEFHKLFLNKQDK